MHDRRSIPVSPAEQLAEQLNLPVSQIQAVTGLLDAGASVPFIARYRKEATGSLDEVQITAIRDARQQLMDRTDRRDTILRSLETHGHLTDALKSAVMRAQTLAELEDIYLPYKPRRRTRAAIAREKGLEPLARTLLAQTGLQPSAAAAKFLNPGKGVDTVEDAIHGARDILAEMISEDAGVRGALRTLFLTQGTVRSTVVAGKAADAQKFKDYFSYEEPVRSIPSHRMLALRRGEAEGFLNVDIRPDREAVLPLIEQRFITGSGPDSELVAAAIADSYKRLLSRAMETETRIHAKAQADSEAIRIFSGNLRQLLLASPLGSKRILALDPGFRTGCKTVCLDASGALLHHTTLYPHTGDKKRAAAAAEVSNLITAYGIEAVAVGNGTAGRETELFLKSALTDRKIPVFRVNESGASIYSASDLAREEFPDLDLTVRGAVSIGRRLIDPLAELVKIDPKSIGVGQYQHDVDQTLLKQALDDVVVSCVNAVGVDVNTASVKLLQYVSGIGPRLAKNIIAFREASGPFKSRQHLKAVPRLGPKAFEQSAGFLRIPGSPNPLDRSAVHPESYAVVEKMATDLQVGVDQLMTDAAVRKRIRIRDYVTDQIGLPTLTDIMAELEKPGRDPRAPLSDFSFSEAVSTLADLTTGMKLPGIVTNVTAFGAFVDIGVHQDGLVHISQLADRFVKNPADVVQVGRRVTVTVIAVDTDRNRISLSMKSAPDTASNGTRNTGKRKKAGAPASPGQTPFNNPFADALKKK
ncbi:MAG: RNA-binding transcriptional accessory protein [Deltaproteobacteria bacterium]|nr:MAG: RNA-binding transcriptional accessory protein [Deltaproteobacteria bacterium]